MKPNMYRTTKIRIGALRIKIVLQYTGLRLVQIASSIHLLPENSVENNVVVSHKKEKKPNIDPDHFTQRYFAITTN